MQTKYLIIGSSHAGLSAAQEIRVHDQKGTLTMISMENCLPYSPTILPYLLEGKVEEKDIYLRDEKYFKELWNSFRQKFPTRQDRRIFQNCRMSCHFLMP